MKTLITLLLITTITICSSCNKKQQQNIEPKHKLLYLDFHFVPTDSICKAYSYEVIDNDRFLEGGTLQVGGSKTVCIIPLIHDNISCFVANDDNMIFDIHYQINNNSSIKDTTITYQFHEGHNTIIVQ